MKVCRFEDASREVRVGVLTDDGSVLGVASAGITSLAALLETENPTTLLQELTRNNLPRVPRTEVRLLAPIERQEVWAVGVTYLRSKKARMEESDFSATAYDRVYDAPRPELFFKGVPE